MQVIVRKMIGNMVRASAILDPQTKTRTTMNTLIEEELLVLSSMFPDELQAHPTRNEYEVRLLNMYPLLSRLASANILFQIQIQLNYPNQIIQQITPTPPPKELRLTWHYR